MSKSSPSLPAQLSLRSYSGSPGSHAHDYFQVLLGLQGELELEVSGKTHRVTAGGGYVIAPGERHDFESRHGSKCLVLDTTHSFWAPCQGKSPQPDIAQALAAYLQLALAQQKTLTLQSAPRLLFDCWQRPDAQAPRVQRQIDWVALCDWAERHLHQPLTVADLAGQVFLSPTQFSARCRQEMGASPMQWLRELRLARAHALRAGGLGVSQIAARCGYRSTSALVQAMRVSANTPSSGDTLPSF